MHREQVTEHLWPDRPADAALNNLHQALRVARAALGVTDEGVQGVLVLRDGILSLCPDGNLWIDAEAFVSGIRDASGESRVDRYRAAQELYRGELLPDDPYAEWAAGPREALAQDELAILAQLALLQERGGDGDDAIETLRGLLEIDPADEPAHQSLMRLYAIGGQRRMALRQYQRLRAVLARELGVEASDESRQLYRDILEGRVQPVAPASPQPSVDTPRSPVHRTASRRRHNLPVQSA